MLKTLFPFEAEFLRKILRHYYEHLCVNRHTLLAKFLGFHAVKFPGGAVRNFVVMNNIFSDNLDISLKFDLKGSLHGRTAFPRDSGKKSEEKTEKISADGSQNNAPEADVSNVIQKDLDFNRRLILGPKKRNIFVAQLVLDSEFLDRMGIMDYSLLLGIHFAEKGMPKTSRRRTSLFGLAKPQLDTSMPGSGNASLANGSRESSSNLAPNVVLANVSREDAGNNNNNSNNTEDDDDSSAKGKGEAAESSKKKQALFAQHSPEFHGKTFFVRDDGGMRATDELDQPLSEVYYMGIIDILQPYNMSKFIESKIKRSLFRIPKSELSAVGPHLYGRRFQEFLIARTGPAKAEGGKKTGIKSADLENVVQKTTGMSRADLISRYRVTEAEDAGSGARLSETLVADDVKVENAENISEVLRGNSEYEIGRKEEDEEEEEEEEEYEDIVQRPSSD